MKIALAQLNYHIGNFELNTQKILDAIDRAAAQGADLVDVGIGVVHRPQGVARQGGPLRPAAPRPQGGGQLA